MRDSIRVKIASLVTALFLGGLAAAGLATRPGDDGTTDASATKPAVIRKKQVRTVRLPSAPVPPAQASASIPTSVSSPAPVSSRVSPAAGGDDDDEYEGGGEERE